MRVNILDNISRKLSVDFLISNLLGLLRLFLKGKSYGVVGIMLFYGLINLDNRNIELLGIIYLINFILLKISIFSINRISSRTGIKPFIYSRGYTINKFPIALLEYFIVATIALMYFNYMVTILNI